MPTELELAWIAGIIDGEGCIDLRKTEYPSGNNSYQPIISVEMTHKETIYRLQELFNLGSIYYRSRKANHKNAYNWTVCSDNAFYVAKLIKDYVFTKLEQINLLLEFEEKCVCKSGRWNRRDNHLPAEILDLMQMIYLDIRKLNLKGKNNAKSCDS